MIENTTRQELTALETEEKALLAEREILVAGKVSIPLESGGSINIKLEPLDESQPLPDTGRELRFLDGNQLFRTLAAGLVTRRELEQELGMKALPGAETEIQPHTSTATPQKVSLARRVVVQNRWLNEKLVELPVLNLVANSWFMLALGFIFLLLWISPVFLGPPRLLSSTGPSTTPTPEIIEKSTPERSYLYLPELAVLDSFTSDQPLVMDIPENTPSPVPVAITANPNIKRVGCPFSSVAGNNGPHGCFSAPSLLTSKAVGITEARIEKARVQEIPDGNKTKIQVVAPAPNSNSIVHHGAYPGETGNLLLFATNTSLPQARLFQVGDELVFTDRNGNRFTYRVISFSSAGEPGRLFDLASPADNWVLDPDQPTALATIVLPLARQLPVVLIGSNLAYNAATPQPLVDDLSTTRRISYRAALVISQPATTTPAGSKVLVPDQIWELNLSPEPSVVIPTPSPATGTSPTPTPAPIPGLPNTGAGIAPKQTGNEMSPGSFLLPVLLGVNLLTLLAAWIIVGRHIAAANLKKRK